MESTTIYKYIMDKYVSIEIFEEKFKVFVGDKLVENNEKFHEAYYNMFDDNEFDDFLHKVNSKSYFQEAKLTLPLIQPYCSDGIKKENWDALFDITFTIAGVTDIVLQNALELIYNGIDCELPDQTKRDAMFYISAFLKLYEFNDWYTLR